MAAISGSLAPWEILPLLVILIVVLPIVGYNAYRTAIKKQQRQQQEEELRKKIMTGTDLYSEKIGQRQQQEDSNHLISSPTKSSMLFGRKAAGGVIIGLAIIVLDLLFFTYVVPVRTTIQFIETIGLLVLGILVWGFSTVVGLMKVSNARRANSENNDNT
jgi:hypothetical protein